MICVFGDSAASAGSVDVGITALVNVRARACVHALAHCYVVQCWSSNSIAESINFRSFCVQLTKAYAAHTSCNQVVIDFYHGLISTSSPSCVVYCVRTYVVCLYLVWCGVSYPTGHNGVRCWRPLLLPRRVAGGAEAGAGEHEIQVVRACVCVCVCVCACAGDEHCSDLCISGSILALATPMLVVGVVTRDMVKGQ